MKKTLFSILAAGCIFSACTEKPKGTTLSGTITGVKSDTILVFISNPFVQGASYRTDTIALKEGKFSTTMNDSSLMRVQIVAKPSGNMAMAMPGPKSILYVVPNTALSINGDINSFTVTGDKFYEEMNAQTQINNCDKKLENIQKEVMDLYTKGELNDSIANVFQEKRAIAIDSMNVYQFEYIKNHPNSDLSAYYFTFMPMEKVEEAYNIISESVKTGPYASMIELKKKQYEDYMAKEAAKLKLQPGMPAPDFSLMGLDGKMVSLNQFKGKYVVLDFWGTWCGWCIKGLPEMKAYYTKYKKDLEIIGIDCRDKEDVWRAGVTEHQIPWINVYNGFDTKVINEYAIAGYPTKVIIDPQGNIVKIVVGESPEFYETLDQLLSKK
ncbi:MAG: redoxin domain-containing protein [Bacteroidales bacterium]